LWILVVEDENTMREKLRQGLEEQNHTVTVAADGNEGITLPRLATSTQLCSM